MDQDNDDDDEDDDNDDDVWNDVELGEAGWGGAGRNNMIMRPSVCCAQIGGRRPHQPHHVKIHTFFRATSNFQLLIIQIFDWNQRNDTFPNSKSSETEPPQALDFFEVNILFFFIKSFTGIKYMIS